MNRYFWTLRCSCTIFQALCIFCSVFLLLFLLFFPLLSSLFFIVFENARKFAPSGGSRHPCAGLDFQGHRWQSARCKKILVSCKEMLTPLRAALRHLWKDRAEDRNLCPAEVLGVEGGAHRRATQGSRGESRGRKAVRLKADRVVRSRSRYVGGRLPMQI